MIPKNDYRKYQNVYYFRSELASDVLILAINWLNAEVRMDKELLAEAMGPKAYKQSRGIVDRLPEFLIEANNIMIFR